MLGQEVTMTTGERTHNAYTVGWVCALPKEQTAATAMLDERHPNLPKPPNDPNTYTLGSIGRHNIVITCLPKGKIGTVSAANVATHLIHAFPAIRFGLMVGIGGGIPRHVRLGDVVVSVPTDQYPGVVQWDMGKSEQEGSFRRTGALNNPPTLLLSALTQLETNHDLHGTKIPQYLEKLGEQYPRIAAQYLKSDNLQDVLFRAGYDHVEQQQQDSMEDEEMEEESESEILGGCRYCDSDQVVKRRPRDMRIRYGLIASGNQVIKDARTRDRLSTDLGQKVLCIDMEAAGLMDGFPCVVIRGICDYADSHKNKAWQKHAAAVAAAFAKELLGYVIAEEVCGQEPANALLEHIFETVNTIRGDTIKSRQLQSEKEDMRMIDWISTDHYGAQQSDTLRRWHPETGQWFLRSTEYQRWLQTRGKTLFCPGIPGAGKTIMASAAIDDIDHHFPPDSSVGLAYIYFSFSQQREQTVESVLASLLTQFARGLSFLPDHIRVTCAKHQNNRTQLTRGELLDALERTVSEYRQTFVVLDAIDECTSKNRPEILRDIKDLQTKAGINILATSRPNAEIAAKLTAENTTTISIIAKNQDMDIMLQDQMRTFDQDIYGDKFREIVSSKIIQAAKSMFLLANLHLTALSALPTKGDILDALDNLARDPDPLNGSYELAMRRIESQDSGFAELAKRTLLWIVHARRRLSTAELQHALAIRPKSDFIDTNYCPTRGKIQSICAGLVIVDEESDTVRLVHYTAQEYFEKVCGEWFPPAHDQISQSCITYLSYQVFDGYCLTGQELGQRLIDFPFYVYATKEWGYHAQLAISKEHVLGFLKKERQVQACSQIISDDDYCQPIYDQYLRNSPNGLHLASRFGLEMMVRALLDDYNVNARDNYGQTPLSWAASEGHDAVVEQLLFAKEVDVNLPDSGGRTPLTKAARNGYEHVVELLLCMKDIDVNLPDDGGRSPLSWAASNGHKVVVHSLLQAEKIDIDRIDAFSGQTPLSLAASNGHEAVVELLLNTGKVNMNFKDSHCGQTPLLLALRNGNYTVVELLLCTEQVDACEPDNNGVTPLSWAASSGNEAIVELLLAKADNSIDAPDHSGRTPLSFAASFGSQTVVDLLLSTEGVYINFPDKDGRTPLSWAVSSGNETTVQSLLFKEDIEIDSPDDSGRTPLSWAASSGNEAIIQLFLFTGCIDINKSDLRGWTPLCWAASNGHETAVELLLGMEDIDVNLPDNYGRTALSWAASLGHYDVVRLILLTEKADVNLADCNGCTPVSLAIENGWEHIVNELMDARGNCDVMSDFF